MLTRDQLLNGTSFLPFEEVDVPELGGSVGVQGMTAGEAIAYHKSLDSEKADGIEQLARLVVRSVVDSKRSRIYGDDDWEKIVTGKHAWPIAALNRVALVAMRLNRGSDEGNLEAIPGADLSSDSHLPSEERSVN